MVGWHRRVIGTRLSRTQLFRAQLFRAQLFRTWSCALALAAGSPFAAGVDGAQAAQTNSAVGIDPYYVGSLLSPSPAVPRAGLIAFEPYVIETIDPGKYGPRGGLSPVSDVTSTTATFTLLKYGITDHLTLDINPQSQINHEAGGFDSGSRAADTQIELEYRFIDQDKRTGKPSLTFSAGVDVPSGRYNNLPSSYDGQGAGTYRARLGLLAQSLLFGESQHPVRIRAWLNGAVPLAPTSLQGITVFGTDAGFVGTGRTGISGTTGLSVEYSATQRLVLAGDIQFAAGRSNVAYGFQGGKAVNLRSGTFDDLVLAPQMEYSFNDVFGIVAGVAFSIEGHNTSEFVQPQIAFNFVLDSTKPLIGIPAVFKDLPIGGPRFAGN